MPVRRCREVVGPRCRDRQPVRLQVVFVLRVTAGLRSKRKCRFKQLSCVCCQNWLRMRDKSRMNNKTSREKLTIPNWRTREFASSDLVVQGLGLESKPDCSDDSHFLFFKKGFGSRVLFFFVFVFLFKKRVLWRLVVCGHGRNAWFSPGDHVNRQPSTEICNAKCPWKSKGRLIYNTSTSSF